MKTNIQRVFDYAVKSPPDEVTLHKLPIKWSKISVNSRLKILGELDCFISATCLKTMSFYATDSDNWRPYDFVKHGNDKHAHIVRICKHVYCLGFKTFIVVFYEDGRVLAVKKSNPVEVSPPRGMSNKKFREARGELIEKVANIFSYNGGVYKLTHNSSIFRFISDNNHKLTSDTIKWLQAIEKIDNLLREETVLETQAIDADGQLVKFDRPDITTQRKKS